VSNTRNYLSERIGELERQAAVNGNEMSRLGKERNRIFAELAEAKAAYAAVEALAPEEEGA